LNINEIIKDLELQNRDLIELKKTLNSNFDNKVYLNEEKRNLENDVRFTFTLLTTIITLINTTNYKHSTNNHFTFNTFS